MRSSRTNKGFLVLGMSAALICGAFALAHAGSSKTWKDGDTLSAADLNSNFSALEQRIATLESQLAVTASVPAGTIEAYGGVIDRNPGEGTGAPTNPPPTGWLFCDGMQLNGLDPKYAALYAAIKTSFGGTESSLAFNLPDLRGRFLRGQDIGAGNDPDRAQRTVSGPGGAKGDHVGSLQLSAFASHNHSGATGGTDVNHTHNLQMQGGQGSSGAGFSGNMFSSNSNFPVTSIQSSGALQNLVHAHSIPMDGASSETRPVNLAVNYIIKL